MESVGALPGLAVEDTTFVSAEGVRTGGEAQGATRHQLLLDLRYLTSAEAPSCASGLEGIPTLRLVAALPYGERKTEKLTLVDASTPGSPGVFERLNALISDP